MPRLKEPLQRRKQQLLQLVARAGVPAADADAEAVEGAGQLQGAVKGLTISHTSDKPRQQQQRGLPGQVQDTASADGAQGQLPNDPFGQQEGCNSNSSSGPRPLTSSQEVKGAQQPAGAAAAAAAPVAVEGAADGGLHSSAAAALRGLSLLWGSAGNSVLSA